MLTLSLGTIIEPSDSSRPAKYGPNSLLLSVELFVDIHFLPDKKEDENTFLEYNTQINRFNCKLLFANN